MSINEIQDNIVEDFDLFDNWEDKYAYIIELGKKLEGLISDYKTDQYKIKGCQSNVWVRPELEGEKVRYHADSDALIVRGLVSLLVKVLSEQKAEDIAKSDLYFLEKIGMTQHLSMTRANGLASMIKQMKLYAIALQSAQSQG